MLASGWAGGPVGLGPGPVVILGEIGLCRTHLLLQPSWHEAPPTSIVRNYVHTPKPLLVNMRNRTHAKIRQDECDSTLGLSWFCTHAQIITSLMLAWMSGSRLVLFVIIGTLVSSSCASTGCTCAVSQRRHHKQKGPYCRWVLKHAMSTKHDNAGLEVVPRPNLKHLFIFNIK